jgi:hypothetical protein
MALGKSRIKTSVKGGGLLKIRMLHPTAADTFSDVGFLNSTNLEDTRNMVEIMDERGLSIDFAEGSSAPVIRAVLKQSSIDEINLVKDADGKYYEIYYYVKTGEGKFQELDIAIGKIKPGAVLQFASATERTIELEIHMLAVATIGATITRSPTGYNMDTTINPYYVLVENAAAINAPADAGATVKTAVF